MVGRPPSTWTFNYEDLSKISGKTVNTIQRSRSRPGGFDPDDFISVVAWCVRNAVPELKSYFLAHAANIYIDEQPKVPRAKK